MMADGSDLLSESHDSVREVRRCLEVIRDRKHFDAQSSIATMRTLEKVFANISSAPDESKYRRLRPTNPKVARLLGAKGVQALLLKTGWRPAVEQMEETWLHDGGAESLPLVRTTRQLLESLAHSDEQAHLAAERQRSEMLARTSKEREATLQEVKADHERRLERQTRKLQDTLSVTESPPGEQEAGPSVTTGDDPDPAPQGKAKIL